jgi:hypothetical protein
VTEARNEYFDAPHGGFEQKVAKGAKGLDSVAHRVTEARNEYFDAPHGGFEQKAAKEAKGIGFGRTSGDGSPQRVL